MVHLLSRMLFIYYLTCESPFRIVLSDVCSKYSYTYFNIYSKYCSGYCIGYYGNQYCYYYDYGTYVGSIPIGDFVGVIIGVMICIVIIISVTVAICKGCLKSDGHRGRMVYPTDGVAVVQIDHNCTLVKCV